MSELKDLKDHGLKVTYPRLKDYGDFGIFSPSVTSARKTSTVH